MTVATTKGSWFNDGATASGKSAATTIGIAVGSPSVSGGANLGPGIGGLATLKGWFLVKDPGGELHIFQQIDTGPGSGAIADDGSIRGIDYSQPAVGHLAGGDPTNKTSQLVYLGMTESQIAANLKSAIQQIGGDPNKISDPGLYARAAMANGYVDLKNQPTNLSGGLVNQILGPGSAAAIGQITPSVPDVGSILSDVWSFLTTPAKWLIILKFGAGVVAVYLGIKALAGIDNSPIAATAAKVMR